MMTLMLLPFTIIAILIVVMLNNRDKKQSNNNRIALQGKPFLQIKTVGVINIFLGLVILLILIFLPYSRMILPILFPLALAYFIIGYRFFVLKQKNRILPAIQATLILLLMLRQVPHSIDLILRGHSKGYSMILDIIITGGLIVLNSYIIYVLYFSKEKIYFDKKV